MHRLTALALRRPGRVVPILVLGALVGALGAGRLRLEVGAGAHLGSRHPAVQRAERFIERFGGGYPLLVVWSCEGAAPCRSVFDRGAIEMAKRLDQRLAAQPAFSRVRSPATQPIFQADPGRGFAVHRFADLLARSAGPATDRLWAGLARSASGDPLWRGVFVSDDGRTGALLAELESARSEVQFAAVEAVEEALRPEIARGFRFHLAGPPIEWVVSYRDIVRDAVVIGVASGLCIAVVLLVLTGSGQATLAALLPIGFSVLVTLGVMGLLGWPFDHLTNAAPTILLVVGAASAIHLVARSQLHASRGCDLEASLLRASREVGRPCSFAAATTAVALLSFASGSSRTLTRFGVVSALGVAIVLLTTFWALPALWVLLPQRAPGRSGVAEGWSLLLGALADFSIRRRGLVLVACGGLTLLCAAGIPRLDVEVDLYQLWGARGRVPRWLSFISDHLRPTDSLELEVDLPPGTDFVEPGSDRVVERLVGRLGSVHGLGTARSILDPLAQIRRFSRAGESGSPAAEPRPTTGELLALLGLADPAALDPWVTLDLRALRISVEAQTLTKTQRAGVLEEVRRILADELPEGWQAGVTGPLPLYYAFAVQIQRTQMQSFATAAALVWLLLVVFLRSPALGTLALLPNLVPAVSLFGMMGHWGIDLDFGSAMVAPIAIGIAVDDTIHFLHAYHQELGEGPCREAAIRAAMLRVGRPMVTTSIALALGFMAMLTSAYQSVANIGLLCALAVVGALVADLLVLPALLALAGEARQAGCGGSGSGTGRANHCDEHPAQGRAVSISSRPEDSEHGYFRDLGGGCASPARRAAPRRRARRA